VFRNVTTLAQYIQENLKRSEAIAKPQGAGGNLLEKLPHAEPFRFVSRVVELSAGESGVGVWDVTGREEFLKGHFPGNPMVPGVLIVEALAQMAGIVGASGGNGSAMSAGKLAQVDVRFDASVSPPAQIMLKAKLTRGLAGLSLFDVSAEAGGKIVARGTLTLSLS
jgi:3-hydroxyacyl-[acyl-carrier-protein] dehydratase